MKAAETDRPAIPEHDLPLAERQRLNRALPPGHRCVVVRLPDGTRHVGVERLPRAGQRRPPRRLVHIPPAPHQLAALDRAKLAVLLAALAAKKAAQAGLPGFGTRLVKVVGGTLKRIAGGLGKLFGRAG